MTDTPRTDVEALAEALKQAQHPAVDNRNTRRNDEHA